MIQDITIVTMECKFRDVGPIRVGPIYLLICNLSNGSISNDLELTLTLFSRSHHSLTPSVSQMATDVAIVTTEGK